MMSHESSMELEDEVVDNDDAGCCTNRFLCLPEWFRLEFNCTFRLAWPMILNQMLQYSIIPISLMFCGRLDTTNFGAAALAMTMSNVTGIVLGSGLATACDTLFSQTYGGDNLKRIGVLLQRSMIFVFMSVFPIWALHLNTESFLILVGQERAQAEIAADFMVLFMPGLLFNYEYQVLIKYLQNQNIVLPLIWIGVLGNVVSALFHYIFIVRMGLGVSGAAMGQDMGYLALLLITAAYIYFTGLYKDTWGGWTIEAFDDFGTFAKYAIPGMFMLLFDFLCFEIGTFAAGLLSGEELAAQSTILQLSGVAYQIPLGTSYACSIRVGQHLGGGEHVRAKRAVLVAMCIGGVAAVCLTILFASSGRLLPSMFTDNLCVSGLAGLCMPLVAMYELFDSVSAMLNGSLRGCGRQHIGALAIFIGFYMVGAPVALSLMFATPLRTRGFWIGMSCAVFGCVLVTSVITLCFTNWKQEAILAQRRAGLRKAKSRITICEPDEKTELVDRRSKNEASTSTFSLSSKLDNTTVFKCSSVLYSRILLACILLSVLIFGLLLRFTFRMPDLYGLETRTIPEIPLSGNSSLFPVFGNWTNPLCEEFYS